MDADGYFQVRIIIRDRKFPYEVRLHLKVDQKTKDVLNLLHEVFGGYVGYRENQDTYYYQSTGFPHALRVMGNKIFRSLSCFVKMVRVSAMT